MTELSLLAHDVGVHERTLRRAVAQGTLRAARPSARTLEMSLSERAYVRRTWPLLATLRSALRTEHNVLLAVVFGSTARGTDTPNSDIDLLVSLRDPSLERIVDLAAKLTGLAGRHVDVIRLTDTQVEPSFLLDAVRDGRVLVDREARWPHLRRREAALRREARAGESARASAALVNIDRALAG